ncbi:MAG: hypothetical protein R3283_09940 [Balneolaceae bacterium]|nr:hypothetical protein [Balneolaceae bacterium]
MNTQLKKKIEKPRFFQSEAMFIYDHYSYKIIDVNEAAVVYYGFS